MDDQPPSLDQKPVILLLRLVFPFLSFPFLTLRDVFTPTNVSLQSSYDKSKQKPRNSGGKIQNRLAKTKHACNFHLKTQSDKQCPHFFPSPSPCYSLIGMAFMAGAQQLFPSSCFSLNTSPLLALVPKQQGSCRGWNLASLHTEARRKQ